MTTFPPTMTDIQSAPPEGVPSPAWQRAVELIRSEAETVTHFWPLWTVAYRKFLRGHSDGGTFYSLFNAYKEAGGRGSTYDRDAGPGVACGEREQAGVTSESPGRSSAGEGHVDGIAVMDIDPR